MRIFLALSAVVFSMTAHGQVYKCGSTFSQSPCGPDAKMITAPPPAADRELGLEEQLRLLGEKIPDVRPSDEVVAANTKLCEAETRRRLKDPESARISTPVRIGAKNHYQGRKIFPGVGYTLLVNAKNSYGGYTGEKMHACVFTLDEKSLIVAYQVER